MSDPNVAVIYYSATGTNHALAETAAKTAEAEGATVRLRRVAELAPEAAIGANPKWKAHHEATRDKVQVASLDDLDWADAYIFSVPTRYGVMAAQMKQFIDSAGSLWMDGKLANKPVTAMSSAQNPHGGQEATLLSFYTVMFHWGAIVVAPGYTDPSIFEAGGNPYGTTATAGEGPLEPAVRKAAEHQARRLVEVARKLTS